MSQVEASRFKIQELHALNSFCHEFSSIEYNAGGSATGARFILPKSLKHDNLVEMNMSALAQENAYGEGIDRAYFKELIGNLNWNKFSERISQQLTSNQNITAEQRRLMQVNLVVALIRSNKFEEAKKELERLQKSGGNESLALKGISAFFALKEKKFEEALALITSKSKDSYSIFLRAQIYLAKKDSKSAFEVLAQNVTDQLALNDDYLIFLLKQAVHHKINPEIIQSLIKTLLQSKNPKKNKDILLTIADFSPLQSALEILKSLYEHHASDKLVQGRYLSLLVDSGNLAEASKLQQRLPQPKTMIATEDANEDEYIQSLIDDGMPERRKEKKTKNIVQETKGGAEIFMPTKKRKREIKYPKNFDPKNPGPEPDPERWLPKWQRSRFKKIAKKKGIYLKGAQGDAQIDTDVTTTGFGQSTAHQEAVSSKSKGGNKRRKK